MVKYILSFDLGSINMACCLIEIETLKICNWEHFSIKDSTNEGSCEKLAKHLDKLRLTDNKDVIVVIENQPRCNVKTILISGFLHMYFVLEKMAGNSNIEKIVGYQARHKINYYEPIEGEEPLPDRLYKLKKGHYRTKQFLIEHCRRELVHNNELKWLEIFEKSKKQDDEADSYIQGLSYIKRFNLRKSED